MRWAIKIIYRQGSIAMTAAGRDLVVLGLGKHEGRGEKVCSYLAEAGYRARPGSLEQLQEARPHGAVLDLSPFSDDGWEILLNIKKNPATRDIPVLPVYLSEEGQVGGVFPVAGFFTLPLDTEYLMKKLAVLGLSDDAEMWDLQTLIVSRKGEEAVARSVASAGFDVVNAYTGKEAVALSSIGPLYMVFSLLMLPDMSALELMEKFSLYPKTRNLPFFVLIKDELKEGEKRALSREIAHLIRKKELSRDEFLTLFKRR
jgi:CheY-like chemotaxis protein